MAFGGIHAFVHGDAGGAGCVWNFEYLRQI